MEGNKKIAFNTILVMIRLIIVGILELWLVQLSLKALGVEGFGLYNVVGGIVLLINVVNTAMSTTAYRYIAVEIGKKGEGKPNEVFCLNVMIYIFLCGLFLLFAESLGLFYINNFLVVAPDMLNSARFVFHISVTTAILSMLMIPYQGVLIAMENFKVKIVAEIIWTLTKVIGVIVMINGNIDSLKIYALIMLLAVIFRFLINVIYTNTRYGEIVKIKLYYNRKLCKEMLFFNNYILLGACVSLYKTNGTAIIINYFFGTALNAAFAVATRVQTTIGMFAENLNTAAIPQIMKSYSGGEIRHSENLVNYISKYSFFLMFAIAVPIFCQLPYLLDLWLGTVPPYTLTFTRVVILLSVLEGLGRGIPALVQATGKVKWFQIIGSIIQLSGIPVIIGIYSMGGPPVAILIIICITTFVGAIFNLYLLRRIINFDIRSFVMTSYVRALLVLLALIPFIWVCQLFNTHSFIGLIVSTLLAEIYLTVIIWYVGIDREEKNVLVKFICSKIKTYKHYGN